MRRTMLKSKIHRATITHADVDYEGSVTIDADLMRAADIREWERVSVWNVTRGTRLETYALEGRPGSGVMCMNGAAAHLNRPGDIVILATFVEMDETEAASHRPRVVRVDTANRVTSVRVAERPGPERPLEA